MGRKILCPHCKSTFDEDILSKRENPNVCPVCEKSLLDDEKKEEDKNVEHKEKIKWYYYKEGGGTLVNTLSSKFKPLYTFDAFDLKDAEDQLKKVYPNNPLTKTSPNPQIMCPCCFSTEFQLVPKRFSILTGFATNQYNRVCNKCGKKF